MGAALLQHVLDLFCLVAISFIAIGLGRLILSKTSIKFMSFGEYVIFSIGLGFGILSYSVFVLGAFQFLYPAVVYLLIGVLALLSVLGWMRARHLSHRTPDFKKAASLWDKGATIVLVVCLLFGFLLVLTPAVGKDALIYHLAAPKLFLKHHGLYFVPGNIFSHYPLGGEMLYVVGLALRGEVLAKGIHFVMGLSILLGMWQFMKHHISEALFIPLALLIFYTIPSVFVTSHKAYNDLTVTFYAFLAVYAFVNWFARRQSVWLILCGVFSGLAMSTKYTALFLPFLGCLGILWACRHQKLSVQSTLRLLLAYFTCTFIVGSPFYIKNWMMTGNPFYPFMYGIFGGKGLDPEQARLYDLFVRGLGTGRGFFDYLLLPWNVSVNARMNGPEFDGILGPVFILMLPFALGMRKIAIKAKIVLTYCLLAFMFWASSAQQIRYLIPIFPFLAMMTAYILSYYRSRKGVFAVLMVFIAGSLAFNGYHMVKDFVRIRPVDVITGQEDRDAFLSRMLPSYAMFQYVNTHLPEDSNVFLIYMKNLGYLCNRPYYSDSMFESYTIEKILAHAATPADVHHALKEKGFTHILYDINYVFGDMSTFSERERDLFSAFQERHLGLIKADQERYYLYRLS
jgi:4-amino-4-deoxy-L-arabinose transferase-like glycosyltransferase